MRPKQLSGDKWRKLERLYLLENNTPDSQGAIEKITGAEAVRALVDQTYHFNFVLGTRRFGDHLELCTRLASNLLVYRLRQLPVRDVGKDLAPLIRAHIENGE